MPFFLTRQLIINFSKLCIKPQGFVQKSFSTLFENNYQYQIRNIHNTKQLYNLTKYTQPEQQSTSVDEKITKDVISKINEQISKREEGRLFAVVQIAGKQFKITTGDIIIIEGYWPPNVGDEISLDKILLIGSADFSLIGRPILKPNLAQISATVIEKTISHTKTHFRKRKRKQYMRINFYRIQQTMLRINSIDVVGEINSSKTVEGNDRIF